ncbi:MAG TPA: hypothetical protein VEI02_13675 [Planctomycetota bacterium]|nr:hypothetical protein [Planctomycetota bacterium]
MICPNCGAAAPRFVMPAHEIPIEVGVIVAPAHVRDTGLLAWSTMLAGSFFLEGLTVRRTLNDELIVTWPQRKADNGVLHPTGGIVDDALRRRVETAVLTAFLDAARRAGRSDR